MRLDRRTFIRSAALLAAGNAAGLGPVGMLNAAAQTTGPSDYKALVCIFLSGGNDANNLLVPFDTQGYAAYASARGPLALAQSSLLPSARLPGFALHPSLSGMRNLFDSGTAGLVANVGTLTQPITRAQYMAGGSTPWNLFRIWIKRRSGRMPAKAGSCTAGGPVALPTV